MLRRVSPDISFVEFVFGKNDIMPMLAELLVGSNDFETQRQGTFAV